MSFDSVNGRMTPVPVVIAEGRTSLHLLVEEATRQLTICNSCRYCEGLCAVFPALERRQVIENGDVSQLANLCHDCRACFDACMYEPPHEFAIDIPKALSAVRLADYQRGLEGAGARFADRRRSRPHAGCDLLRLERARAESRRRGRTL
jgi:ferredoxin